MTGRLNVKSRHREQIERLLREHLPNVEVWAYGSRVNGRSHDGSDLDLVLRSPGLVKIDPSQLAEFNEAVQESTVPFLVEARDWARLPESFHREIERDYVVLVGKAEKGALDGWGDMSFADAVLVNPTVRLERGKAYPFVDMAAVTAGSRCAYGAERREYSGGGSRFQNGDTLMARITPCLENGKIARYCTSDSSEAAHGSTEFIIIRGRPGVTDTEFAYYLTQWEEVRSYAVSQMTGTSGRQRVPAGSLGHLAIAVPSLPEQRAIAHILGTLDDKIELNRRMNETLEAMARALFKSWFVDFDPVRAKAALRRHREAARANPLPLREGAGGGDASAPSTGRSMREGVPPPQPSPSRGEGEETDQALRWEAIRRGYSPRTIKHAKTLRQNQTDAEGLLWHYLRNKQLGGYKFRRQQPIGPYIADFACLSRKLLIELDGSQHAERKAHDEERDAFLRRAGYRVLRFWNNDVFENCFGVLESIYAALHPHPSFAAEPQPPQSPPFESELSPPPQSLPLEEQPPPRFPPFEGEPPPQSPPPLRGRAGVGGDPSPKDPRLSTLPQGEGDWTVERARAYLDRMDLEIAALFPDRFVDSELGEIPEGWEVYRLNELAEHHTLSVTPSARPDTIFEHFSIPAYDTEQMPALDYGESIKSNKTIVPSDAVLCSKLNPEITRVWLPGVSNRHPQVCSTEFLAFTACCPVNRNLLFCLFTSEPFRDMLQSMVTGTSKSHQRVPPAALKQREVLSGTPDLLIAFGELVAPMLKGVARRRVEIRTLAALRDILLPKLVPGELRISNVNIDFARIEG